MSQAESSDPSFEDRKQGKIEQQAHNAQLADAVDDDQVEYLRELIKHRLDPGTVEVLDNYVGPSFVLGNDREKDYEEFKWQLEIKIERVIGMHPPENGITGKLRAAYYDDPTDVLSPLRPDDRELLRSYKVAILARRRRSIDGFQQDKIGETTSRVETVENDNTDSSRGLFG